MASHSALATLVATLDHADAVFRLCPRSLHESALVDALAVLGNLYVATDDGAPEVNAHLNATYDACIRALGQAFGGDLDRLTEVTNRVRAIASMFESPAVRMLERHAA